MSPRTAGVTDNPRPRPLGREQPIGIGTGGNDPGPGGHPGGPMGRRRGPVSWGGTRQGVLRFRLPVGAPLARRAPPLANPRTGRCAGLVGVRVGPRWFHVHTITKPYKSGPQAYTGRVPQRE